MVRRFFNPKSNHKIALAAGAAVLVGVAVSASMAKPKKRKVRRNCNPSPYSWDLSRARAVVNELMARGENDQALVAVEAASRLFGTYPGGGTVTFPPAPDAVAGVSCVWTLTVQFVNDVFEEGSYQRRRIANPFEWVIHSPNDSGYPWEEPSLHPDNYPSPGMFFDVGSATQTGGTLDSDHTLDKTVRRALAAALLMANMDPNLAVGTSNTSKRLRREMRQLILGSEFHDKTYGQTDANKAGGNADDPTSFYVMNEKGRGLNWLPHHADNLGLMAQGRRPKRTTTLDGERIDNQREGFHMLLWIPAIDLAKLSDVVPTVVPYLWLDGSSTKEPPPVVQNLGVDMSDVAVANGVEY